MWEHSEMEKREKLTSLNALHSRIYIRNWEWLESLLPSIYLPREIERVHCKEIWIYIFPKKKMRGLSPNFQIREIYIFQCSAHLFSCSRIGWPIRGIYIYIAHRNMNVRIGTRVSPYRLKFFFAYKRNKANFFASFCFFSLQIFRFAPLW